MQLINSMLFLYYGTNKDKHIIGINMDLYVDCTYFARGKEAWQVVHPLHSTKENVIFAI